MFSCTHFCPSGRVDKLDTASKLSKINAYTLVINTIASTRLVRKNMSIMLIAITYFTIYSNKTGCKFVYYWL